MSDDLVDSVKKSSESSIVDAKQSLDDAVSQYTTLLQLGSPVEIEQARSRLHTAVITLFWRMRGHLVRSDSWDDVSEFDDWDGDVIWSGDHPQTGERVVLTGLSDLDDWVESTATVEQTISGPKFSGKSEQRTITQRLPSDAALSCAQLLSQMYTHYGWDAETDGKLPRDKLGGQA